MKNEFGQDERPDAITLFLRTKVGYCVQFATAMVMMAREAGIPARMAIGFLPGTADRGTYTVRASDAHAWPELYFEGIGWLRFEPTPSGTQNTVAPPYSLAPTTPGTGTRRDQHRDRRRHRERDPARRRNDPGATDPSQHHRQRLGASAAGSARRPAPSLLWVAARARSSASSARSPSRSPRAAGCAAGSGTHRTSRPGSRSSGRR